jgi:hypothetical protein
MFLSLAVREAQTFRGLRTAFVRSENVWKDFAYNRYVGYPGL